MKKIINSGVSIILVVLLAFGTLALSCSAEGFGAPPGGGMGGGDLARFGRKLVAFKYHSNKKR